MVDLVQYLVGGLTAGTLYGLVALGIVLLYRSSRVLNFAHGDLAALAINGLVVLVWGADTKVFPFPLSDVRVYRLGGVVISQLSLGLTTAGLLLVALLYLLVQRTRVGLAMRAVAQALTAAQALGIPSRRIFALTWGRRCAAT